MKMKIVFTTFLFLNCFFIIAQNINTGEIEEKKYFEKIPYTIVADMIIVKVSINNKNYNFHLDTGAPFSISDEIQNELELATFRNLNLTDSSGKIESIETTIVPKINLGEITFTNTEAILFNKENFIFDCLNVDGIIGSNMLRNSVLQFDYENKSIYITDDALNLNLENVSCDTLTLNEIQSDPLIDVLFENDTSSIKMKATIDSGSNSLIGFPNKMYDEIPVDVNVFNEISKQFGFNFIGFWGFQDENLITLVSVPKFIVTKFTFENIVLTTDNISKPLLGNQLFKYGKTTIDYKQKRFYFEPFKHIEIKNFSQRPFAIQPIYHKDKFIVGIIWDETLNSEINIGDEILSFNGINYTNFSLCDFLKSNRETHKNSVIVKLKDIKTDEIKTIEINRI